MSSSQALPPNGDLLLLQVAREAAQQQGFVLETTFEAAFLDAVKERWSQPFHTMEVAEVNTNHLISAAITLAKSQGKQYLDDATFRAVLSSSNFCPLWPFC